MTKAVRSASSRAAPTSLHSSNSAENRLAPLKEQLRKALRRCSEPFSFAAVKSQLSNKQPRVIAELREALRKEQREKEQSSISASERSSPSKPLSSYSRPRKASASLPCP